MRFPTIFYNPISLLLISFGLSIYTSYSYQFVFNVYGQIIALTFVYYLLICYVNDLQLVLRKILPWYVALIIPFSAVFLFIVGNFGSNLNIVNDLVINLSIISFFYLFIASIMYLQVRKTSLFIRDNLSDYLISEELAIPHVMAYRKYYFRDFTALIYKMKTVGAKEAKEVATTSTLIRPTKDTLASGALLQIGATLQEKQLGNTEGYMFDVYLETDLDIGYNINQPGLSHAKKVFRGEEFDDQKLRTLAREIDSQVEKNLAIVYLTRHIPKHPPVLKLVFNPEYFETEPTKVYHFISELKRRI